MGRVISQLENMWIGLMISIDLEEVDYEDVKMRLFAQSLSGEEKKWFRDFPARSILTFQAFQTAFLERWDDNKIPL